MRPGRWKCLRVMGATPPLWIPAFAGILGGRHDYQECLGPGRSCFRANRWLVPAHPGVLTGAGVCGSFATHTPTLDSAFAGMTNWGA